MAGASIATDPARGERPARLIPDPQPLMPLRWLLRTLIRILFFFEYHGKEHVPAKGAVILAANHTSYLDPPLVALGQDRGVCFMAWDRLFHVPVFNWIIRKLGAFPVSLLRHDPGSYRKALACLRAGRPLVIFPEGGRSPDGRLMPLREGVAALALHSGAPIVPVRIEGAFEVWPRTRKLPRPFRKIKVLYGEPLQPPRVSDAGRENRNAAAQALLAELARRLNAESCQLNGPGRSE